MNINAKFADSLNQLINEIRVKKMEGCGPGCRTVICDTIRAATCANSKAIYPPPINRILRGSSFSSKN
jgi:hypothetical protein